MELIQKLKDRLNRKSDDELKPLSQGGVYNDEDLLGYKSSPIISKENTALPQVNDPFDKIYSLEKVDPKTIRKMTDPSVTSSGLSKMKHSIERSGAHHDETLDFGFSKEGSIESLRLSEPIQVLGLSNTAEQKLLENNKKILKDLLNLSQQKYSFGQGHIDEIQTNLEKYLQGSALHSSRTIDYLSLLNKVFADLTPLTAYFVLKPFQLDDIYPLSQPEKASLGHMKLADKENASKEARAMILQGNKVCDIEDMWKRVVKAFVHPWMRNENGIASIKEIRERLISLGGDEILSSKVLLFIEKVYFNNKPLVLDSLEASCDQGVYCLTKELKSLYEMIMQKTRTYFYRPSLSYQLSELSTLLYREFARSWNHIPENLIERALTLSPYFRVRKGKKGLTVRLH